MDLHGRPNLHRAGPPLRRLVLAYVFVLTKFRLQNSEEFSEKLLTGVQASNSIPSPSPELLIHTEPGLP